MIKLPTADKRIKFSWKNKLIVVAVKSVSGDFIQQTILTSIFWCFCAAGNAALSQRSKIRN